MRARLESALGLSVRLANVSYPRPGCTLLKDVELADLDVGRTVASARLVEISDDARGETIFASQPDLDATASVRWQALIEGIVRRPRGANPKMLRMAASELTLHWPGGAQTFCQLQPRWNQPMMAPQQKQRLAWPTRMPRSRFDFSGVART